MSLSDGVSQSLALFISAMSSSGLVFFENSRTLAETFFPGLNSGNFKYYTSWIVSVWIILSFGARLAPTNGFVGRVTRFVDGRVIVGGLMAAGVWILSALTWNAQQGALWNEEGQPRLGTNHSQSKLIIPIPSSNNGRKKMQTHKSAPDYTPLVNISRDAAYTSGTALNSSTRLTGNWVLGRPLTQTSDQLTLSSSQFIDDNYSGFLNSFSGSNATTAFYLDTYNPTNPYNYNNVMTSVESQPANCPAPFQVYQSQTYLAAGSAECNPQNGRAAATSIIHDVVSSGGEGEVGDENFEFSNTKIALVSKQFYAFTNATDSSQLLFDLTVNFFSGSVGLTNLNLNFPSIFDYSRVVQLFDDTGSQTYFSFVNPIVSIFVQFYFKSQQGLLRIIHTWNNIASVANQNPSLSQYHFDRSMNRLIVTCVDSENQLNVAFFKPGSTTPIIPPTILTTVDSNLVYNNQVNSTITQNNLSSRPRITYEKSCITDEAAQEFVVTFETITFYT